MYTTTSTHLLAMPELVSTIVFPNRVELIYIERESLGTAGNHHFDTRKVFKVICSCIDGQWNQSERIYGHIIPPAPETYRFLVDRMKDQDNID